MNRNLEDNGTSAITCSFCIAYLSLTLLPAPPWIFSSGAHRNVPSQGLCWWSSGEDSASQCRGWGSVAGRGTKIPHDPWWGQKIEKQKERNVPSPGFSILPFFFFFNEIQHLSNTMLSSLPELISLFDNQENLLSL